MTRARPCPFCRGHEESTLPALETYGPGGQWLVRVVPNLYPAFDGNAPMVVTHLGPVFTQAPASGIHEVFVLSPDHHTTWADLSDTHSGLVMATVRDRMEQHAAIPGLRYSQAVVNSGRRPGPRSSTRTASCCPCPSSLARSPMSWPGSPAFRATAFSAAVIDAEEEADHRVVYSDERVVVVCPFWSGTPYQMLVLPRNHHARLYRADDADLSATGRAIQLALAALTLASVTWPTT